MQYWPGGSARRHRARRRSVRDHVTFNMLVEHLGEMGLQIACTPNAPAVAVGRIATSNDIVANHPAKPSGLLAVLPVDALGHQHAVEADILVITAGRDADLDALVQSQEQSAVAVASAQEPDSVRLASQLRSDLANYLLDVADLAAELNQVVDTTGSFQDLIDIAEEYFGCFINLTDANQRLVAHTRHVHPATDINRSLIVHGYHTKETLAPELSDGYLSDRIAAQKGVVAYPPSTLPNEDARKTIVTCPITVSGQYFGYLVMEADAEQVSPGTIDSFKMLSRFFEALAEKQSEQTYSRNEFTRKLLTRIIEERDLDRVFIEEQAERLGLPYQACFALLNIQIADISPVVISSLVDELDDLVRGPHEVFSYRDTVVLFMHAQAPEELMVNVDAFCSAFPTNGRRTVYLADYFSNLHELRHAYAEINAIKRYETAIRTLQSYADDGHSNDILPFAWALPFYTEDPAADPSIREFVASHVLINQMLKNDLAHGTDDLKVLLVYLSNERKATVAGRNCHMHRNGVLYRIEKIEQRYHLDLSLQLTREYLLTSVRIRLTHSPELVEHLASGI